MVKVFHRRIKVFLTLEVRKFVLEELAFGFVNLVKLEIWDLAKCGFLANFSIIDRYSIPPPTTQLAPLVPAPLVLLSVS